MIIGSLPLFLLGTLLFGLNRGTNSLGRYASADANPPRLRARAISLVVMGGTVGSVFGPIIVGWVSNTASNVGLPVLSGPWFAASLLLGIAFLLVNLLLRPDPHTIATEWESRDSSDATGEEGRLYREILRDPNAKLATGALIFAQLAMIMVMTITPLHMHVGHHELTAISLVIMAHTLGMFGLSFVTGWLVEKQGHARVILIGGLILVVSCLSAPFRNDVPTLAAALFLLGLGWNFCFVAGSALLATVLRANERGRVQGLTDAFVNIASGLGSVGSGLVFAALGFSAMSWSTTLVAALPIALVLLFHYRRKIEMAFESNRESS